MDSFEDVKSRVQGWIASQRKGEDAELPCFWTMYPVATLNTNPAKHSPVFCENYHTENIEESVEYLMEQMGNAPHVKYYAVRLRAKKGEIGPVCNFPNPYYKSSQISGFGNLPTQDGMSMTLIGLMQQYNEQRIASKEENTMLLIESIKIQNQQQFDQFKKEQKYEKKIDELKAEIEGLKGAKSSAFMEFIAEIKPELKELIKYKISGQIPYEEEEDNEEEEIGKHDTDKKPRESVILDNAIELLKDRVKRPEELVYKMAVVLNGMTEDEATNLLSMLQAEYKKHSQTEQK